MKVASLIVFLGLAQIALAAEQVKVGPKSDDKVEKVTSDALVTDNTSVNFYDLIATRSNGDLAPLKEYRGKVALVANTASKCGYTSQYENLQSLYKKYEKQGLVVLGFPSNDFRQQEPGTNEEIATFCKLNYGVTFPLFEKNPVTGEKKQPVFEYLTTKGPAETNGEVKWNFEKFLINRKGEVVARFPSKVKPDDPKVVAMLEGLLKEPVPPAPKPSTKNIKGN